MNENSSPTIHDLYPHLTQEQLAEAEDNLERYTTLVLRIFERTELEVSSQADLLTPNTGTLPCTPPGSKPST